MEKPITIQREEFAQKIVELVKECRLPAFVIETILRGAADEAFMEAKRQYAEDKQAYEASLSQEQLDNN